VSAVTGGDHVALISHSVCTSLAARSAGTTGEAKRTRALSPKVPCVRYGRPAPEAGPFRSVTSGPFRSVNGCVSPSPQAAATPRRAGLHASDGCAR